jgi:hypothetical protein
MLHRSIESRRPIAYRTMPSLDEGAAAPDDARAATIHRCSALRRSENRFVMALST